MHQRLGQRPYTGGGWEPEGNWHLGANPSQNHLSCHDTLIIRSSRPIVIASLMLTADPEAHYLLRY
jgi:hypothetical protein